MSLTAIDNRNPATFAKLEARAHKSGKPVGEEAAAVLVTVVCQGRMVISLRLAFADAIAALTAKGAVDRQHAAHQGGP